MLPLKKRQALSKGLHDLLEHEPTLIGIGIKWKMRHRLAKLAEKLAGIYYEDIPE